MARRRWKCFRPVKSKGYQKKRSRSHRREYVRGGADPKITMYDVGNRGKLDWEVSVGLMLLHSANISHFTLEAIRVSINRRLQKIIGRQKFHLKIRAHPHITYREHAMMAFAGADRLSSGMRNSFGRPVGRMAKVRAGQMIIDCGCDFKDVQHIKRAFAIASQKLCVSSRVMLLDTEDPAMIAKVPLPHVSNFIVR